jgi:outer membrane protein assembly factor BamB
MNARNGISLMALCLAVAVSLSSAVAGPLTIGPTDWPCWRGPERTDVSRETGLLKQWPESGPRLLWTATGLGSGYSTPSVAGGRVFLMGSRGDEEWVMALDAGTGKILWSTKVGAVGKNEGPNYPGPRCTPTVEPDSLYTLGSDGDLVCADPDTGKVRWRRHLVKDFDGRRDTWAYCESPLIDGEKLICTPGGPTATLVALNKKDGSVIWKAAVPDYNFAGYASAIVAEAGGIKQYVQFLGAGVVGIDARDGRFLWRYRRHVGGQSCTTPIFHDGCIFSSASATGTSGGDALLRLVVHGQDVEAQEVYRAHHMKNHHGGVVRIGEALYGTGGAALVCLDFKTGAVLWKERCVGKGSLTAADGHLYVRGEQGAIALVEANPAAYKEKGRFRQPSRSRFPTFCHPVVAGGQLYLRDADLLFCYDIREANAPAGPPGSR